MLWKCCTQYTRKLGKLTWGHRSRKGQFASQFQAMAMPKNVYTTIQLHSFHMVARSCSKSFKLYFNSTWTETFQIYKLGFEEAEEPEIKLSTFTGSQRKQVNSRKMFISNSFTTLMSLVVWFTKNHGKFLEMGMLDTSSFSWENCMWVRKQQLESVQVQSWMFIARTDAEAKAPILWPLDAKSQFGGKGLYAGKRLKAEEEDSRGWDD